MKKYIPLILLGLAVLTFALNAHFSWHLFDIINGVETDLVYTPSAGSCSCSGYCTGGAVGSFICPLGAQKCELWYDNSACNSNYTLNTLASVPYSNLQSSGASLVATCTAGQTCAYTSSIQNKGWATGHMFVGYSFGAKAAVCGDNFLDTGEQCDPPGTKQACTSNGQSGVQNCNSNCLWNACQVQQCTPASTSCQGSSVVTCDSTGMNWINPSPCPTSCISGKCTICSPEVTQTQECGNCGQQTKTCDSTGQWGMFGTCQNQGCAPTTSQSCNINGIPGQQICNSNCQWGNCQQTGVCKPGDTQPCSSDPLSCGVQTCGQAGAWGACTPKPSQCGSGYTCQ